MVVLVVFFTLCTCLSITVLAIICWLRPCNRRCVTSCLPSTNHSTLPSSRRRKRNMKTLPSFSSERPLSCGSFHSSSHGSGSQETEESSEPLSVVKQQRSQKSVSPLARCSVYSDSGTSALNFATLQLSQREAGSDNFASLGHNFRPKRNKRQLGHVRRWMMENSITDDDMQLQTPGRADDVVAAHALLQLPCGESQPHYTATKFHSFRAKKPRRTPTVATLRETHFSHQNPQHESLLAPVVQQGLMLQDSSTLEADSMC